MIDTTKLRELAKMTPEQNTDYERLKQAAASVWSAGNMYIGPSMRELMRFLGEYKRLSPEYIAAANPATVLALLDELDRTKGTVAIAGAALSAAERELDRLRTIEAAARNLAKVKGRHNSEIAMNQLLETLR